MTGDVSDVPAIIGSKGGLKYAGADVDAMRAVAKAYQDRSLQEFQATLQVDGAACATHLNQHCVHAVGEGLLRHNRLQTGSGPSVDGPKPCKF